MVAEFDRLDKDKSGELDVKELAQSQFQVSRVFAIAGKSAIAIPTHSLPEES